MKFKKKKTVVLISSLFQDLFRKIVFVYVCVFFFQFLSWYDIYFWDYIAFWANNTMLTTFTFHWFFCDYLFRFIRLIFISWTFDYKCIL